MENGLPMNEKRKKIFPVLFGTLLLDMIGIGMVIPLIPILFTDPSSPSFLLSGYSQSGQYFIAGSMIALFGLMQFIAAPILGELSDIFGRKKLLVMGVAVLALSQLLFGLGVRMSSLGILFFSRAVAGLAGANFSIAQASIADVTEPKDRAKNFGLIGAAFGIGFILGPLLGGLIAKAAHDASAPFWFAGGLGMLNVIFISLLLPETHREKKTKSPFTLLKGMHNIRAAFADPEARPVYLASFLYMSGFSFFTSFIGILLVARFNFSEFSVGTFFAVVGAWIVITQLIILRMLSRKYHEIEILKYSLLALALGIALYPFMPNRNFLYIFIPFLSIPQGLSMANMGALISKSVSAEKQGAALGINGSLLALSQGVIPIIAGAASGYIGIQAPFVAGAVFIVIAWSMLFVFLREKKI
ncbi:MFS transporter [Candidatus Woesearchaeota archaeon]|nr:MFS transporter [Candidatus Woesearchaeota archaeon]